MGKITRVRAWLTSKSSTRPPSSSLKSSQVPCVDPWKFTINPDFCYVCRQIISETLYPRWREVNSGRMPLTLNTWEHDLSYMPITHRTVQDLTTSRDKGCKYCGLLLSQVPTHSGTDAVVCLNFRRRHLSDLEIEVYASCHRAETASLHTMVFRRYNGSQPFPPTPDDELHLPRMDLPYQEPASEAAIKHVRTWIENCDKWDSMCLPTTNALPTRVLDLASMTTKQEISLFLTTGESAPYATLSYCWGTGRTLKTTKYNLGKHQQGIPVAELPRTLKDAAFIAHELGFRYLWIDALCIIQQDEADWNEESSKMHEIYGNSSLNICAASALHSNAGFLQRHPDCGIPVATYKTDPSNMEAHADTIYSDAKTNEEQISTMNNTISSRGWVLQERLLSPRTVYYTDQGMLWECRGLSRDGTQCEVKRALTIDSMKHNWGEVFLDMGRSASVPCTPSSTVMPWSAGRLWTQLVTNFAERHLIVATDTFPAFSGVARAFAAKFGLTYIAGMWKENFLEELLWSRSLMSPALQRRSPWVAPSWSWASVQGKLNCFAPGLEIANDDTKIHLIEIEVSEHKGGFGAISHGSFTARGSLQQVVIQDEHPEDVKQWDYHKKDYIQSAKTGFVDNRAVRCILDSGMPAGVQEITCWCLRIGTYSADGLLAPAYLLLEPVPTDGPQSPSMPQIYHRIGYASVNPWFYSREEDTPGIGQFTNPIIATVKVI